MGFCLFLGGGGGGGGINTRIESQGLSRHSYSRSRFDVGREYQILLLLENQFPGTGQFD